MAANSRCSPNRLAALDIGVSAERAVCAEAAAQLAELRPAQGRLEEAERLLEGFEEYETSTMVPAALAAARGDVAGARRIALRRAHALGGETTDPLGSYRPGLAACVEEGALYELLAQVSDPPEFEAVLERLDGLASSTGCEQLRARALRASARARRHVPDLERAHSLFTRLHLPLEAGRTRLALAVVLTGDDASPRRAWPSQRSRGWAPPATPMPRRRGSASSAWSRLAADQPASASSPDGSWRFSNCSARGCPTRSWLTGSSFPARPSSATSERVGQARPAQPRGSRGVRRAPRRPDALHELRVPADAVTATIGEGLGSSDTQNTRQATMTTSVNITTALGARLHGEVVGPADRRYDEIRAIANCCRASRPVAVVRCADADDVATTVRFAVAEGLPLAVRAGGHSAAGHSSVEDGLVIDLRAIDHVRVDSERRVAAIGGGALAGQVDRATHPFGLATTTATVSSVGVAGFTLSGGIGYLTRKHGLAVDNLVGADVVLADGTLVRAGEGGDEDLLWGLTGGGGNLGVVTELRMRLHPVSVVTGGPMLFPLERIERLVRLYRDWIPQQPDDIYAFLALLTVPPEGPFPDDARGRPACALVWCNTAPQERSEQALAAFRAEQPLVDGVGRLPYPALQTAFDAGAAQATSGHLAGLLFEDLPDAAAAHYERFGTSQPTSICQSHLYPLDGAAARADRGDTAWPWRGAAFAQMFAAQSPVTGCEDDLRAWSTGFRDALAPYAMPGCYANFLMDEGPEAARACYGSNADRLSRLKRRYDPANVFRLNQNIAPAGR